MNGTQSKNDGVIYMILSVLLLSASNIPLKHLAHLPVFHLVFFRSCFSILLILLVAIINKTSLLAGNKQLLLLRGFLSGVALLLSYYAIPKLPLSTVSVIANLAPLYTIAITAIVLKERIPLVRFIFVGISLFGIILMIRSSENPSPIPIICLALAVGISAIGYVIVHKCFDETQNPILLVFYTNAISLLISIPGASETILLPLRPSTDWIYLGLSSVLVLLAQYLMNLAYTLEHPAKIATITYTSILYSMLFGYFIFHEVITSKDAWGLAIVITGIFLNEYWFRKKLIIEKK
jgi:drug/metabolite transporter (DMT)-like permease